MPAKTDLHKRAVLNVLRGQDLPAPKGGVYLGLMTELPTKVKPSGVELLAREYQRQLLILGEPNDEDACTNAMEMIFPVARSEDWPAAPGVAIFFAPEGGAPRYAGKMSEPVTVKRNQQVKFEAGALTVREL